MKKEKHEKIIIAGDFNAQTSLAFKKCHDDGTNIIPDECNENGNRLKTLCMANRLCSTSTYFYYLDENRYTWYSCDEGTKRLCTYGEICTQYVTCCIYRL